MQNFSHLSETKRQLLERYLRPGGPAPCARDAIAPRPLDVPAPLSLFQEQLWLQEREVAHTPLLYNECITLRMLGPLNISALGWSLLEILRRHEIWRTSYGVQDGRLVQRIHPAPLEVCLPTLDLRGRSLFPRETEAREVAEELVGERFDLQNGPLLRFKLVRTGDFDHRLFVCAHLSVVDGVSVYQVFPRELAALYISAMLGRHGTLPSLAIQFGDYAYWQRGRMGDRDLSNQLNFWKEKLTGRLPVLGWPDAGARSHPRSFIGAIYPFILSKSVSQAVAQLSRNEGVTLFMVLATAFAVLLHHYTDQEDIIVGTPSPAGRKCTEVENLLGYFLNPVPLRFRLSSDLTFRELLCRTQQLVLEALSNDEIPLQVLAREICPGHHPRHNPFFRVAVSLQPSTPPMNLDWTVTSMDVSSGGSPWELYVAFISGSEGMMGRVQYNPEVFGTETIARFLSDFHRVLECMTASPTQRLSRMELRPGVSKMNLSFGEETSA